MGESQGLGIEGEDIGKWGGEGDGDWEEAEDREREGEGKEGGEGWG